MPSKGPSKAKRRESWIYGSFFNIIGLLVSAAYVEEAASLD